MPRGVCHSGVLREKPRAILLVHHPPRLLPDELAAQPPPPDELDDPELEWSMPYFWNIASISARACEASEPVVPKATFIRCESFRASRSWLRLTSGFGARYSPGVPLFPVIAANSLE